MKHWAFIFRDVELTYEEALEFLESPENLCTPSVAKCANLCLAYDMMWQRRSTGKAYNSLSGLGVLVGSQTNKIVEYGVRQKDCRKCTFYKNKSLPVPEHTCYKNFDLSAKAMEADLCVELVKKVEKTVSPQAEKILIDSIIMDEDSATMARLREEIRTDITKISDIYHILKSFVSTA